MKVSIKSRNSWLVPLSIILVFIIFSLWSITSIWVQVQQVLQYCQTFFIFHINQNPALVILLVGLFIILTVGLFKAVKFLFQEARRVARINTYLRLLKARDCGDRCWQVTAPEAFAFTIGWFRPKIIFTTTLMQTLSNHELEAVLSHEQTHRKKHDPLRRLLARLGAEFLFFVPLLRDMVDNFALHQEYRADKVAARKYGQNTLLSGMKKILNQALDESVGATTCPILSTYDRWQRLQGNQGRFIFKFEIKRLLLSSIFLIATAGMLSYGLSVKASTFDQAAFCQAATERATFIEDPVTMSIQPINMTKLNNSLLIVNK